jgi:hypothetical protein
VVRLTGRSTFNGNGQSIANGPDATQRDWQLTMVRQAAESFWKYV